ncbi:glycoside hydrolase family 3 N-terminal domain-containing protein [uncultured Paraglaciecola sp.]|uniref:beta-glucosidase family protein n=1 Tax=uncultured Paraglaciecola sp. TaxID=1765024 RepID=UPI0030DD871D|tara:strand:- start:8663 stop:11056 length:2394 start_codon:yes stop_codon:yes gene_type:complete
MLKINHILLMVFTSAFFTACDSAEVKPKSVANPMNDLTVDTQAVDSILANMSIEDKVAIVSGMGFSLDGKKLGAIDRVPGTAGYTAPLLLQGLKSIALADGPAGLRIWPKREGEERTYYATAFPIATIAASTWDTAAVTQVGQAMGNEVKEYGVDVLLAPGMNLHRNPLAGRNFEYYSEDPLLSGSMAAAMVNGIESNGVGATIKHFTANNQETNRMTVDTLVSERALRELYLKGFEIAINKSHPWAIMSSYNAVNGTLASENQKLLTEVLREEWQYEGVVMTDWFAGKNPAAQLKAGNDLLMPGVEKRTEQLRSSIKNGEILESQIDINVRRILSMLLKSPTQNDYQYSNAPDLKAHAEIARSVAAQGTILLKNNHNTLPLANNIRHVGAFGTGSYAFFAGGSGSGDVNEAYTVSLVEGLENTGINIHKALSERYVEHRVIEEKKRPKKAFFFALEKMLPEMPLEQALVDKVVATTDMGLITIGRNSGEFEDRALEGDFYLTQAEKNMIKQVSESYHESGKKVVVVLNIGNVIETVSWRDQVDAIILPWQGGQEAGNALADVLTGKVNPSGKLPSTFPINYDDVPSAAQNNFPGIEDPNGESLIVAGLDWGKPSEVLYQEGIFVGYRYFDTFEVDVAYPFGFGLSYSTFAFSSAHAGKSLQNADNITFPVTVTNTGRSAGQQVVQLYVSAPRGNLPKPKKELKDFAKTKVLQPGESQTLRLSVNKNELASFSPRRRAWIVDKGRYQFHLAKSVNEVVLSASLQVPTSKVVSEVIADLSPKSTMNELSIPNPKDATN